MYIYLKFGRITFTITYIPSSDFKFSYQSRLIDSLYAAAAVNYEVEAFFVSHFYMKYIEMTLNFMEIHFQEAVAKFLNISICHFLVARFNAGVCG